MNRIVAILWGMAAIVSGFWALFIALGPKGDASAWFMALGFAVAAGYCAWLVWREWKAAKTPAHRPVAPVTIPRPPPATTTEPPGAWRGPPVPLETQIEALSDAGLSLAPGRTIDELLTSWSRADYEGDPYNLLLFMYGCDVEAEPWGRAFCERGWNFDTECLSQTGDYASVFESILRTTGQPQLATQMSDDFSFDADSCEIRYSMNGRQKILRARVDDDWADPDAVAAFVHDIETTIADGRHFLGGRKWTDVGPVLPHGRRSGKGQRFAQGRALALRCSLSGAAAETDGMAGRGPADAILYDTYC